MEVIRLVVGVQATVDADCIRIEELEGGSYGLTGTALCVAEDEGASVSLMNGLTYATKDEAEEAGLTWAGSVGVACLFISAGTFDEPLDFTEIDFPN